MKKLIYLFFTFSLIALAPLANAEESGINSAFGSKLQTTANRASFKTDASVNGLASNIISIILSVLGVVFIILIIYSGLIWMTAGGSSEKVDKASGLLKQAIIGLVIVFGAYGISYFVLNIFLK